MNRIIELVNNERTKKVFKYGLIAAIFLYPFIHSFIGIDLGDTGLHTFMFSNLYDTPELIGFTSYFTSVVGWAWLQIFGGLGLWGLNLLEVIIEMLMVFAVYNTFKKYLGEYKTLMGLFVAVTAADTYLNVFNYHQFNVFLLVILLCFEFKANVEDKTKYSVLSGILLTVVIFSRMGSVTALVTLFFYFFWCWIKEKKINYLIKHLSCFAAGAAGTAVAMILLLVVTGQTDDFVDNIFRLSGMASASSGGYSMNNLLDSFIGGNLDAIASGAIFLAAAIVLLLGANLVLKKEKTIGKKFISVLIGLVAMGSGMYQLVYAYDVNPAPAWPQMTSGPAFIIGVFYVVTFLCIVYHLYAKEGKHEVAFIAIQSIVLPLLTIAGSNTGTKHVTLGLWIIAPVVVYVVLSAVENPLFVVKINQITSNFGLKTKKAAWILTIGILCVAFCAKFAHMIRYTMNFESIDRSEITETINNPRVKFLRTTEREADAVNGVLAEVQQVNDGERPLMVFGGSLLFYYMTDMDSYVQPWFSNTGYSDERLENDLERAYKKYDKLPVVIYGRTNNYYGFYEHDYKIQVSSEARRTYSGKKERFIEFLEEHDYQAQYMNDYYIVLYPPDIATEEVVDYSEYITVN